MSCKQEITSVYFVGIGGIGMSALARYFNKRGVQVAGYDLRPSDLTRALEAEGISIHYDADPAQIPPQVDLAVYTPAVPDDFPELTALRTRGVPLRKRAEVLGMLSADHRVLGVAGTHGKTTTSTIAAYLMREARTDCVAFLGGISSNYRSNFLDGGGEWLVVEADEYDRSFLQLQPEVTVVTYIEPDHLDIYSSARDFEESFEAYLRQVKPGGTVVTKPHIATRFAAVLADKQVITYGVEDKEADYRIENIHVIDGKFLFNVITPVEKFENIKLGIPGQHNVENAVAAVAAVGATGQPVSKLLGLLEGFTGIERRFELLGRWKDTPVISDYAHHPTEVSACISAAKALYAGYRIIGIFQPHLYSRTRDFASEFGQALSALDEVILLDLYPAREKPIPGITSMSIFIHISNNKKYLASLSTVEDLLNVLDADVLLFMGAGSVDGFARHLLS